MENKSVVKRSESVNMHGILYKAKISKSENRCYLEEYPKLRIPKPATLFKLQGHNNKADILKTKAVTIKEEGNLKVSLTQTFLSKHEQLEKANKNIITNEVRESQGILLDDDIFSIDSDDSLPFTLHMKLNLLQLNKNQKSKSSSKNAHCSNKEIPTKSLNYLEDLLVGIFYTKVRAHPNGFFAENLPHWYRRTFDKDPAADWLELIQASNKFYIENVQNNIVLYAKSDEDLITNIDASDEKAFKMEHYPKKVLVSQKQEKDVRNESSVVFTRYKHLQKSLQECSKNAGRYKTNAGKNIEKHIKPKKRSGRSQ